MNSENEKLLSIREERLRACLHQVLENREGVEVLAWVVGKSGYQNTISYQDKNPEATSFLEGRRSLGHDLCEDIGSVTPDGLENILTFIAKERAKDARINRNNWELDGQRRVEQQ